MHGYAKTIFWIIACTAFISCTAGNTAFLKNWGKIIPDAEATKSFETYLVRPDLNYYLSGSDVYPDALLGLNKDYTLISTLWKKVELTPATLRILVDDMKAKARDIGQNQFGFAVLDNQGKKIGIWFSILFAPAPVHLKEDKQVIIYTPDQNIYEKSPRYGNGIAPLPAP